MAQDDRRGGAPEGWEGGIWEPGRNGTARGCAPRGSGSSPEASTTGVWHGAGLLFHISRACKSGSAGVTAGGPGAIPVGRYGAAGASGLPLFTTEGRSIRPRATTSGSRERPAASGCGSVWKSACFGSRRPQVRFLSPGPYRVAPSGESPAQAKRDRST